MTRLLPFLLAALLICSLPAIAVPGSVGPQAGIDGAGGEYAAVDAGSIDWLALSEEPAVSGDDHVTVDVGATLEGDSDRLEARYDDHHVDVRIENADSEAEQRAIVREEEGRIAAEISQLREHERAAYVGYYGGDIDEHELLVELAVVHTNAAMLEESVSRLEESADEVPEVSLGSEIGELEVETLTMQGPVRERVAEMLRGETDPERVHVESDGNGVVLALVDGDQFHREAYRDDNREPDAEAQYASLGQSEDRIAELYPSIFPEARWSYSEVGENTHRGIGNHAQGSLTTYLDTGTGEVYRESQTLRLGGIDATTVGSDTDEGVELTVSGTLPGGPAQATLTDAETGDPLSGEIELDDRAVGETDDGTLWFVAPRSSVTVTATVGEAEVTVEITEGVVSQSDISVSGDERS
ncbi:DUF7096 domain-containing protein [Halalkalicoccus tibetensis]|uniref:DUF5667 domain-containing protein n=1 Tax=Halalkalicoccus tibetensis TaxID=175632 RepID=A0ABD5V9N6_9EURY